MHFFIEGTFMKLIKSVCLLFILLSVSLIECIRDITTVPGSGMYEINGSADRVDMSYEFNGMNLMVKARMNRINIHWICCVVLILFDYFNNRLYIVSNSH